MTRPLRGAVPHGPAPHDPTRHDPTRHDTDPHHAAAYDAASYDAASYDVAAHDPALVDAMRRALAASVSVHGATSPNPPVGAVVIDVGGTVVGVGATAPPGGPHAEVTALREAGLRARGGTAVVTLEPCAHHGRTPPCTEALAAAGVATVVFAVRDPHPRAGGGAAVLRAAGVAVREGMLAGQVARGPPVSYTHLTLPTN